MIGICLFLSAAENPLKKIRLKEKETNEQKPRSKRGEDKIKEGKKMKQYYKNGITYLKTYGKSSHFLEFQRIKIQ